MSFAVPVDVIVIVDCALVATLVMVPVASWTYTLLPSTSFTVPNVAPLPAPPAAAAPAPAPVAVPAPVAPRPPAVVVAVVPAFRPRAAADTLVLLDTWFFSTRTPP